ncbi:MAG: glycosyltransferase family 2 protein [Proteobacteria bacterium]|nr:MAG: glycosyltransferase family 2 protein [Pseudomonadota bacterium]
MMGDARVLVSILNWNRPKLTIECLESLEKCTHREKKIVVIDNGSSDDSIAKIRKAFPSIEIIANPTNVGFGSGHNISLRMAQSQGFSYTLVLNNDALVSSDTISKMVLTAKQRDASLTGCMILEDGEKNWSGRVMDTVFGRASYMPLDAAPDAPDYVNGACLLVRTKDLLNFGLFDERYFMYWEDADLSFRYRKAGLKLAVSTEAFVEHKLTGSIGKAHPLLDLYHSQSSVIFYRKYIPHWFVLVPLYAALRVMKKMLSGEWANIPYVIRGTLEGCRLSSLKETYLRAAH